MTMTNARRLPSIYVPDHVENAQAYIRAAQARIAANAAKGARTRWISESGEEVVTRCVDFLYECGEFAPIKHVNGFGEARFEAHPIVRVSFGDFRTKMIQSESEWGRLTKGQEQAVLRMIEKGQERVAAREAAKAEKAATAKHIGTVGERREFDLTIVFVTSFETQFGTTFVNICEDADANVVVYKGSNLLGGKGEKVQVKATIKAHDHRDGVAQTIISRPKAK
jgi:predicted Fe-S protein YdhL (DUF1289 family)